MDRSSCAPDVAILCGAVFNPSYCSRISHRPDPLNFVSLLLPPRIESIDAPSGTVLLQMYASKYPNTAAPTQVAANVLAAEPTEIMSITLAHGKSPSHRLQSEKVATCGPCVGSLTLRLRQSKLHLDTDPEMCSYSLPVYVICIVVAGCKGSLGEMLFRIDVGYLQYDQIMHAQQRHQHATFW